MPTPDLDALERLALTARELGFNANLHPTELDWLIAQARAVERVRLVARLQFPARDCTEEHRAGFEDARQYFLSALDGAE